jgi:hypothetical protein
MIHNATTNKRQPRSVFAASLGSLTVRDAGLPDAPGPDPRLPNALAEARGGREPWECLDADFDHCNHLFDESRP